ncbi:MAG: formylglycine-generating enzyme family protein [Myxococcaceae bacterium]
MKPLAWVAGALLLAAPVSEAEMVRIGPGTYRPIYPPSPAEAEVPLGAFRLDRRPVTNAEFLEFVRRYPRWQKDRVSRLFADSTYLNHWEGSLELGQAKPQQPVTQVSWFAARAYCQSRGARLPTEAEWEFAASASQKSADGRSEPGYVERILSWYSRPTPKVLPDVGQTPANFWGVRDLHGLVWEWVSDFGNTMISGDSRDGADPDKQKFCGEGAANSGSKSDYASFMRIAFRNSLQAPYALKNLGFRCARDLSSNRGTR